MNLQDWISRGQSVSDAVHRLDGHLINFRDDNHEASPLAHTVNVEFDGASAKFGMDEITGSTGSYFKLCAGRGMSDAEPRFSSAPYGPSHAEHN